MSWEDTCGVCGNDLLWWRSRSGYRVCMVCARDPLEALEVLARRGRPGAIRMVQGWRAASVRSTSMVETLENSRGIP
jgi:hypothetical protein